MSSFFKWNMLVTSFLPLWVSVIFVLMWDVFSLNYPSLGCLLAAKKFELSFALIILLVSVASVIAVTHFVSHKRKPRENSGHGKILAAQKSTTIVTDFLLTYIMPLIAFDFTEARDIALFFIYFVLIVFLNIRNGNVYSNVLFELMGYRVYVCTIEREIAGKLYSYADSTVISKENLSGKINHEISFFDFDNSIYLNLN